MTRINQLIKIELIKKELINILTNKLDEIKEDIFIRKIKSTYFNDLAVDIKTLLNYLEALDCSVETQKKLIGKLIERLIDTILENNKDEVSCDDLKKQIEKLFENEKIFDEKENEIIFKNKINYHNLNLNLDSNTLKNKSEGVINNIIKEIKNTQLDNEKKNELYLKCYYSMVTINNAIIKDNKKLCIISPMESLLAFNIILKKSREYINSYTEYNAQQNLLLPDNKIRDQSEKIPAPVIKKEKEEGNEKEKNTISFVKLGLELAGIALFVGLYLVYKKYFFELLLDQSTLSISEKKLIIA